MKGKVFINKIILFIFILVCIVVSLALFNMSIINKEAFKFDDNINKLILGSSDTECAINDNIFKNSINMSSSADPFFYSYLKMRRMVEINPNIDTVFLGVSPRIISKFIDERWLLNNTHFAERFGNYYSLMGIEDLKMLKDHFGYDFYKIGFANVGVRSFRNFKEYLIGDLRGIYGSFEDLHRNKLDEALNRLENDSEMNVNDSLSKNAIEYLNKMIEICRKNDIELIFISTPLRKEFVEKNYLSYIKFNNFYETKYSDITYMNFTSFELPDSAFADLFHLNSSGSVIFTQYLQKEGIKNIIFESDFSNN